ncbi:MAG: glycerol-3-phosphate 1-O-acyltransferase PlsY [Gluconobacter potus]|uniref:Glycerol-3-phosphate acyltransferase n=1 Tax=Gluconobacter potus TaxID=2724927 RepID=A0ABR9YNV3_9PROT|nr:MULTISPECIES: glycerol-3-phosphate 1-O-acyltransferase PlsY [Gluconobacter]MBF0865006.1 glycerol-3-phosphate 1-O-acyltransferase PlsY [Gluconobacter sp. R71656]MBF0868161.1 glycerol-3-phosphate 1-O-acyltransferase PlsY [Gluconobacter sp. R75628]MBF0874143.1 glycerol-3-phosphate 1-O-acyltransferase PlsY [Gluconobacter sp. R75629]MBF0883120.1 glycerol-3-phosphate 1-O-acyltransferase PlsY [Gluconobacter potus]
MSGFQAQLILLSLVSYVIGSIPFGLLLTAVAGGGDIRKIGSGNIGATNVLRTGRRGLAAATLLLDALKGALAVLIARFFFPGASETTMAVAAVAVVIGHCFPVWLGFRGGKGVATGLGTIWVLCWLVGLACCVVWLLVARLSRISSAGALAAFLLAPGLMVLLSGRPLHTPIPVATLLISLLIWARHSSNIARLVTGREPRVKVDQASRH